MGCRPACQSPQGAVLTALPYFPLEEELSPTGLRAPAGPPGPGCFPQRIPQCDRSLHGAGASRTGTTVHALVAQGWGIGRCPRKGLRA